jgi:hypothetical protein
MSEQVVGKCWHCGRGLMRADFARENTCPGCGKSTRSCRNCRWYTPGRPNDCREPMVERILDKEKANYCELFQSILETAAQARTGADKELRQAAEDLFK